MAGNFLEISNIVLKYCVLVQKYIPDWSKLFETTILTTLSMFENNFGLENVFLIFFTMISVMWKSSSRINHSPAISMFIV